MMHDLQNIRLNMQNCIGCAGIAIVNALRYTEGGFDARYQQRQHWQADDESVFQIYFTGVQAIGPVITLGLAVGVFAIAEGVGGIGSLSGAESLGRMVTVIVLREIGPMLTGGVVIARSVTAIASELILKPMTIASVTTKITPTVMPNFFILHLT